MRQPNWVNLQCAAGKYVPSPNIGPKTFTPILLHKNKVPAEAKVLDTEALDDDKILAEESDRVLCEMQWGLVPSWHKGNIDDFKFNMINCRSDTILEKASFRGPLERGQRCVAVAEGFFEWKAGKDGKKQPYFIHAKEDLQDEKITIKTEFIDGSTNMKMVEAEVENETEKTKDSPEKCKYAEDVEKKPKSIEPVKKLVFMAALYDMWKSPGSNNPLYTYTIITVGSSSSLNWLHERMPAILENEDQIRQWLDYGEVCKGDALKLLKPMHSLTWYPVSSVVNNVRNKSDECLKEIDLSVTPVSKKSGSSNVMSSWLKKSAKKRENEESKDDQPGNKKTKLMH